MTDATDPTSAAQDARQPPPPLRLAVVGAGPVGLALALLAARQWPQAQVTVFDARPADKDVGADPRTLALSLGSVQLLRQLGVWPEAQAQPITEVHVSQAPPTFSLPTDLPGLLQPLARGLRPEVRLTAAEQGVAQLGAVLSYGQLVAPLQAAWAAVAAASAGRHVLRLGQPVQGLKPLPGGGVEVDAGVAEAFDLAVIAEGGVFADQSRKAVRHDYRQTAWVGTVTLEGEAPAGCAFERFTRQGPVALLPLPPAAPGAPDGCRRASLVWCVPCDDDPVAALDEAQRRHVLASLLPPEAGRLRAVGPLKAFALGLNAEASLVSGRTVRIGNAAQTLHPVAGQGLNLGLRDAVSLVRSLRGAPDLDAALRRVAWERAPDRWGLIATTDFLARSFTWSWPGLGAARGLGLAALQALPPLKGLLARQMMFGRR
ncbi:FAD-dependent monooxygenase [Ideonella livida]|uniref:2-octaprenyl-6-methoxyphenyl hydroxylase n=1 Tax=Ideonella livida TaxID=2707176 RepID=A0A7C9PJ59_9BURK|nr:FAD-dependent monooxygenase [Ideonella livida]NDY93168.1 2-octaprenyl-6-methoxyphenyl hydroxylase [Ideonella livida]